MTIKKKVTDAAIKKVEEVVTSNNYKQKLNCLIEEKVTETSEKKVQEHIEGDDFKKKLDITLGEKLEALVSKSEKRAMYWAGLAALVIVGIFGIYLTWQYTAIKEKEVAIYDQYISALILIEKIKAKVVEFEKETSIKIEKVGDDVSKYDRKINQLHQSSKDVEAMIEKLQRSIQDYEKQIGK